MTDLLPAGIVVLFASIMQACTGFGFSVLATPFLLLVYDAQEAIQINIILSILISLWLVPSLSTSVDKGLLKRLVLGSVIGGVVGLLLYVFGDASSLRLAIGVILLALTTLILTTPGFAASRGRDRLTGGFSGALTSGLGMPGPPLLVYFAGARMDKAVLRGTTLAYFLFIYTFSLLLQIVSASSTWKIWTHAAALTPVTLLGVYVGNKLFHRVDQGLFMRIIYVILIVTGLYLVGSSI